MTNHDFRDPFQNIQPARRCQIKWASMKGDDQVRRCDECKFRVYELSNSSQEQAAELLKANEKRPVIELFRREDGRFMVRNCPSSIWRKWFGPSYKERWAAFADDHGIGFRDGGAHMTAVLTWQWRRCFVTADTHLVRRGKQSHDYTRLSTNFETRTKLSFKIYRKTELSDIATNVFGAQDIAVGDSMFDDAYVVQCSDGISVHQLLKDATLRGKFCSMQRPIEITVSQASWNTPGISTLKLSTRGIADSPLVLEMLFDLFNTILERLLELGYIA